MTTVKAMKIEIKNVKIHDELSDETTCFSATLYINGKRAAAVTNRGGGGPHEYGFKDRKLETEFFAWAEAQSAEYDIEKADQLVDDLIHKFDERRLYRGTCRRTTLFKLKGEAYAKGAWRTVESPFSPVIKKYLVDKYKEKLGEIMNETLEASGK